MKNKWQQQSICPFSFSFHSTITLPALCIFPHLSSAAVSWKSKVPGPLISMLPQTRTGWSVRKLKHFASLCLHLMGVLCSSWGSDRGCEDPQVLWQVALAPLLSCSINLMSEGKPGSETNVRSLVYQTVHNRMLLDFGISTPIDLMCRETSAQTSLEVCVWTSVFVVVLFISMASLSNSN